MSAASDAGGSWPVKVGGGQLCRHARPGQPFCYPLLREWSSAQQRRSGGSSPGGWQAIPWHGSRGR